jgi:ATP-binding cassette subfamily C (CFTR/MRP) protein 1
MQLDSSTCRNDNTFGPFVQGCRDDFDFTIVFEQSFFSIAPSAVFILLATFRILYLSRKPRILKDGSFQIVKLVLSVFLCLCP